MRRAQWLASDDGEQSYLVSISDLMAGLLFVFIITVTVFALLLKQAESERRDEVQRLRSTEETRGELLQELEKRLKQEGVEVTIDLDHGVLRLPEEVLFQSGYDRLVPGGIEKLDRLARVLSEILPEYTPSVMDVPGPSLEAVMVEGHTDSVPLRPGGQFRDNWHLSTARAIRTYTELVDGQPTLTTLMNVSREPVLGVAGYADSRPASTGTSPEDMARNRRIDLRFLMAPPELVELGTTRDLANRVVEQP